MWTLLVYLTNHTFTIIVPIVDRNISIKTFLLASTSITSSKRFTTLFLKQPVHNSALFFIFFLVLFFYHFVQFVSFCFFFFLLFCTSAPLSFFLRSPKMATNVQVHGWSFFFFWFSFEHPSRDYGVDPAWLEISVLCFFVIFIIFFFVGICY